MTGPSMPAGPGKAGPIADGARVVPTAAGRVAARLQAHIQAAGLRPGDRLGREDELAKRLDTSRIVLREALRLLAATHLIRTNKGPGGGVFVANTFEGGIGRMVSQSVAELLADQVITATHLLEARIAIEVPLAGAAARIADDELTAALSSMIDMAEAVPSDRTVIETSGAGFHRTIAHAASNRIVGGITAWMFDVLEPELDRLQGPNVDDTLVLAQHREICTAIGGHDPEASEDAMRRHLLYLAERAHLLTGK